jgi:hypothetical protein
MKKAPLCRWRLLFVRLRTDYLLVAFAMLSRRMLSLTMLSLMATLSTITGAGAIAGDVVSMAVSSFLAVHAASTRTAAKRARRFIYNLLEGKKGKIAGPCTVLVLVFGAGENLPLLVGVSRVILV